MLARLQANRHDDAPWRAGRIFSLVFPPDDPELERLLADVSAQYLAENALNPARFPSLARLETAAADMVAGLLHGPAGAAGLTSGGTESIFVAVSVARDVARERGVQRPFIVTAETAHPAFAKACHLLDIDQVRVPVRADKRLDVAALTAKVGTDTALVVASAPCYPYGVVDPVEQVATLAAERGVPCHVDACLGGLILPFLAELGQPVPPWDFRVPGVTSISADVHKYGYSFKGASVIAFATPELAARRVWFDDGVWGGGTYGTPTPAGTRPAPPIAGAWAALTHLGHEGYRAKAAAVLCARDALVDAVASIDGLRLSAQPDGPVLRMTSDSLDMAAVADAMEDRRWWLNRQPGALHVMLSPLHARVVDELTADLRTAVAEVRAGRTARERAAVYAAPEPTDSATSVTTPR
ncbi:pyridoxal phosphate-dependent decarboxylase family protein [uncultured Jatrophihabitans sp.]|uniref:pyridoxal phosphate-dependent decarboxylase family protein n=1 Tax=uncultured Jatrophihabitans sp. TaxID=1610747 RepID=UPI0035CA02AC